MGGLIAEWASRLFLFFCWRGSCELVILFLCCTVQYGTRSNDGVWVLALAVASVAGKSRSRGETAWLLGNKPEQVPPYREARSGLDLGS